MTRESVRTIRDGLGAGRFFVRGVSLLLLLPCENGLPPDDEDEEEDVEDAEEAGPDSGGLAE